MYSIAERNHFHIPGSYCMTGGMNSFCKARCVQSFVCRTERLSRVPARMDWSFLRTRIIPECRLPCIPGPACYGITMFLCGIDKRILEKDKYGPLAENSWGYTVGYVQPIGDRAIPGQIIDRHSTANFGVGAFLLAASEMYHYRKRFRFRRN